CCDSNTLFMIQIEQFVGVPAGISCWVSWYQLACRIAELNTAIRKLLQAKAAFMYQVIDAGVHSRCRFSMLVSPPLAQ
ncbi:MAG: hypothetical protein SH820_08370, partial [Xanthomonadales bacterium]|nr:hypothetical protein [Xanthomonadales bacterium]